MTKKRNKAREASTNTKSEYQFDYAQARPNRFAAKVRSEPVKVTIQTRRRAH